MLYIRRIVFLNDEKRFHFIVCSGKACLAATNNEMLLIQTH
jgi:hypothetical protein